METFLERDSLGKWNTIPPVPADKIGNVNCHRFVLYVLKKMSWGEMVSDAKAQKEAGKEFTFGKTASMISNLEFTPINNSDELVLHLNQNCEIDKSYIGQILDTGTQELAHSFIIKKIKNNKFQCFDKPGFKYPFGIYGLEEIYDFVNKDGERPYKNQSWRVIPIADL
jgi:hypothetical protein